MKIEFDVYKIFHELKENGSQLEISLTDKQIK